MTEALERRIAALNTKYDSFSKHVERCEPRLDAIDRNPDGLGSQFNFVKTDVQTIRADFDKAHIGLNASIREHSIQLTTVSKDVVSIQTDLRSIQTRTDTAELHRQGLASQLSSIERGLNRIDSDLKHDVDKLKDSFQDQKQAMNTLRNELNRLAEELPRATMRLEDLQRAAMRLDIAMETRIKHLEGQVASSQISCNQHEQELRNIRQEAQQQSLLQDRRHDETSRRITRLNQLLTYGQPCCTIL